MKMICFLFLMATGQAYATPADFTCKPDQSYSGGFDIFHVTRDRGPDGHGIFHGTRYWQATFSHGTLNGKPQPKGEYILTATVSKEGLRLDGLPNTWIELESGQKSQHLVLPLDWETGPIQIESELFYNDINWTLGSCAPGKDALIQDL